MNYLKNKGGFFFKTFSYEKALVAALKLLLCLISPSLNLIPIIGNSSLSGGHTNFQDPKLYQI